jgi:ubiquinone/menaquinone biosynthesis C-methylase UbiE
VLDRARLRSPEVTFIAGDFLALPFEDASFDVVISLEVLSHVADHVAFLDRCAAVLRPGGRLMLATQNRPVLERLNDVPPAKPGQLRRWVDAEELRTLLARRFEVEDLYSVTLRSRRRHPIRLLTSSRVDRALRPLAGRGLDTVKGWAERRWGWTLMARARVLERPDRPL